MGDSDGELATLMKNAFQDEALRRMARRANAHGISKKDTDDVNAALRALGYKTAILSGGFNYFGRYLQKRLGIDYVFANELEMEDNLVTGRVTGRVVDGQRKAELLRELADQEGIRLEQTIAVGDGANDLPMLSIAGLGIAFRAKPLVRENAKHSISTLGLDGILYLLGYHDRDIH